MAGCRRMTLERRQMKLAIQIYLQILFVLMASVVLFLLFAFRFRILSAIYFRFRFVFFILLSMLFNALGLIAGTYIMLQI
jgi:hypothetical protein